MQDRKGQESGLQARMVAQTTSGENPFRGKLQEKHNVGQQSHGRTVGRGLRNTSTCTVSQAQLMVGGKQGEKDQRRSVPLRRSLAIDP